MGWGSCLGNSLFLALQLVGDLIRRVLGSAPVRLCAGLRARCLTAVQRFRGAGSLAADVPLSQRLWIWRRVRLLGRGTADTTAPHQLGTV